MQYTASGRLCQSLFLRFFTFCISFLRKLESKRKRRQRGTAAAVFSCSDKAEARRRRRKTSGAIQARPRPPGGGRGRAARQRNHLFKVLCQRDSTAFPKASGAKKTKSRPAASKGERTFRIERGRGTLPKVSRYLKGDAAPRASCVVPARPSTACAAAPPLWGSGRAFCFAQ